MESREEHVLEGGNASGVVVRVGQTVRKAAGPQTPAVEAFLSHLEAAGFTGAPRTLGRDDRDRHILEFVPGQLAIDMPPMDAGGLHRVGQLIRELHDKSESFEPPQDSQWRVAIPPDRCDLICHHDLAPWNLVVGLRRWAFIDWDEAGPGSRLWDLAYTATCFVPLDSAGDPAVDGPRLRALADGYGLSAGQRRDLPALTVARTRAMSELLRRSSLTGEQPWARLYAEGHGDHWGTGADYIERNLITWARALL